jgi:hypothetical protein
MFERRKSLKGVSTFPLATILSSPALSAAVSAGLKEVTAKLSDGRTIRAAITLPEGRATGRILLVDEWWGLV